MLGHTRSLRRRSQVQGGNDGRGASAGTAAIGAWLPVEAIPVCFLLATGGAFVAVLFARWRGESFDRAARIPFGAFLCPSLWFTFFLYALAE